MNIKSLFDFNPYLTSMPGDTQNMVVEEPRKGYSYPMSFSSFPKGRKAKSQKERSNRRKAKRK